MGIFFSGNELLQIAVGIEKRGEEFYESLTKKSEQPKIKALWDYLAGEERRHRKTFQHLLDSLGEEPPPEIFEEEFSYYLKALVNNIIFTGDKIIAGMANKVSTDAEAIQIGIGFEKDSILFFLDMRALVREVDRKVVDKVIGEERAHLRRLCALQEELARD